MAKKIVRGITDVKTINNQDFDTNNVNDLLSDGQYNYIHRKKGKSEEYHNLTDNIKTISSDNTELLSVTNNNKTTNTATLSPKHDAQKEQLLESTRDTITIHHGTNGTDEKTTVDTNPKKVLEHENLISSSQYVTIEHEEDSNTTEIKTDNLVSKLNELDNKIPTSVGGTNLLLYSADPSKAPTGYYDFLDAQKTSERYNGSVVYRVERAWRSLKVNLGNLVDRGLLKVGDVLTYSVAMRAEQKTPIQAKLYVRYTNQTVADSPTGKIETVNLSPDWQYISVTFTVTAKMLAENTKVTFLGWDLTSNAESGKYVYYACNKVERGNIATDYCPAPEDIYPLLAQKEQLLESTRNTVTISHGENGTAEKTTVDVNFDKVQAKLTAGTGITIQGNTISATGGSAPVEGASVSIQDFTPPTHDFSAQKKVVTIGQQTLTTFVFTFSNSSLAESVITGELKQQLEQFVLPGFTISNGAVSIKNDGTNIKLINSAPLYGTMQQGIFTYYYDSGAGGGIPET